RALSFVSRPTYLSTRGSLPSRLSGIWQERPMTQTETQSRAEPRSSTKTEGFILDLWGIRYQVADVARSVEFYTKQLGFKLDHQKPPAFAQISVANLKLILSGPGASGSRKMPDGHLQAPGGWNRVILHVENLPDRIEASKKKGLRF